MALEGKRVAELEALLGGLRASQYRAALDCRASGSRAGALEERNSQLQEQART